TALWIGVVCAKPRWSRASSSVGSVISELNGTGAGSNGADSRVFDGRTTGAATAPRRRPELLRERRREGWREVVSEDKRIRSARAEGDDAAGGIVRRNSYGHPVARNDLDPVPPHPAAQLRQHFVAAGIHLHAVQATTVNGDHRPLNINQIVLAHCSPFSRIAFYW